MAYTKMDWFFFFFPMRTWVFALLAKSRTSKALALTGPQN